MKVSPRIKWIDLLRTTAIFCVILCHVTEGIYKLNLEYISSIGFKSKIFVFSAFTLGRLGVPFFLLISGYLLLDKNYDYKATQKFWTHNCLHLLICTEVWFLVYEIFLKLYLKQNISTYHILLDLLFIHKVNMSHVWYMPMILGMYMLIPLVSHALKTYSIKQLQIPLLFFAIYAFGYPFLNIINNALNGDSLSLQMSLGFSGGVYGIYLVIGYMLKKGWLKQLKSSLLFVITALFFMSGVALQLWAYSHSYQYNMWYDCPFLLISSVALFELFSRIKRVPIYSVINWIAYYSFAVYLIHNIFRSIIMRSVISLPCIQPLKVIVLRFFITLPSFLCAWIINKIPKIGKYVLYTK